MSISILIYTYMKSLAQNLAADALLGLLQVICGNRLPISLNCDPTIAEIMTQCWEGDPQRRPNFEYIHRRLKERHTQLMNEEREVRLAER